MKFINNSYPKNTTNYTFETKIIYDFKNPIKIYTKLKKIKVKER